MVNIDANGDRISDYTLLDMDPQSGEFQVSNCQNMYMSLVVRKPVFGVSDQVPHKPGCTATEDG